MCKLKKLRKSCERLAYQVQSLELKQRIAEIQQEADKQPVGFFRREGPHGKNQSE